MFERLDEYTAALDDLAAGTLADADIVAPPVDALQLAERLGMVVARDDAQVGRARRVRLGARSGAGEPQSVILVRDEPRPERRHWSVAHEIGEHLAEELFQRLGIDPREAAVGMREQAANALANRLLLPSAWFEPAALQCGWDLPMLKQQFCTASHELIARRMLDCSPPVIISIYDQGHLSLRRDSSGRPARPPSSLELLCWRRVHTTGEAWTVPEQAPRVFGWPIHEASWKREILRTVLAAD